MNNRIVTITTSIFLLSAAFVSEASTRPYNSSFSSTTQASSTLSLDNLERERAALVQDLLDSNINTEVRYKKLAKRQASLSDMERMVMRDERLLQSESNRVSQAFTQYDSTFLVHAGAEHKRKASEQWLASVKLSNSKIMSSTIGYRK